MTFLARAQRIGKRYQNPVPTMIGGLSMLPKVFYQYLRNQEERVPRQTPGPFRTDPRIFEQPPSSGLRISWFGHSSTLVEIDGVRVLIDPVWDERAAPVQWAGPRRFFPPTLPLAELPRIDVVLISHDHYDHLGAGTVRLLAKQDATAHAWWVTPLGVGAFLQSLGVPAARLQELDWTGSVSIRGLKITALPSRHFSGRSLWNRFHTLWASFVLEGPSHRVFYGADSGEWPGFAEIGQQFGPFDLTMLEIGAFHPLWSDIHMGPEGAVRSFQGLGGGGLLMPIHWGLFDLALHGWRQPIDRISSHGALKLWSPTPGEPTEVQAGVELRSTWWRQS